MLGTGTHQRWVRLFVCGLVLLLTGCGEEPPAPGDPARGAALFTAQACAACHAVGTGGSQIGPDLRQIGTVAATRVPGQSAEHYLDLSIVFPAAFVVPGYAANVMPLDYGSTLPPQARRDLVAYLLSLR